MKAVKDYFTFSRKERIGIYILITIIIICITLPFLFPFFIHQHQPSNKELASEIPELNLLMDSTGNNQPAQGYSRHYNFKPKNTTTYHTQPVTLFYFDPNTLSAVDWTRLGIRDKTISTIEKYLSHGGHFYKPEDIGKIWGLHEEDIKRLLPYVRIGNKSVVKQFSSPLPPVHSYKTFIKIEQKPFDINIADSAMLDSLPGIGPKLAKRMLAFREKLGGFVSVDQVKETYALPDSTFNKIKPKIFIGKSNLKKININTCTLDELKIHPYIRYTLANPIIQYRTQHGSFTSIEDIKKIVVISDEIYEKISPYLTIQN